MHQGSPPFPICRAASSVIPMLPRIIFTPYIQPNHGRLVPPSTEFRFQHPSCHTLLILSFHMPKPSQYSLICSTRKLPSYSSSPTHLFIPNSNQPNLSNASSEEHSLSFSQHFSNPMPLLRTTPLVQLLLLIDTSWPLSPILYYSAHFSALPTLYTPHSFCAPHPFHLTVTRY